MTTNTLLKAIAGKRAESAWQKRFAAYRREYPDLAAEFERRMSGQLPAEWDLDLPKFDADPKGMATRAASGKVINALAGRLPELIGGSADLTPSNNTWINNSHAYQPDARDGRYIHFGVREHAMGSLVNGIALHGGLVPYGGTFLVFSDYMRPAIRLSALSEYHSVWVFTHDSVGLGEDGPTHQPIEHLAALRAIPHLSVIRPADANEVREAWRQAVLNKSATALLLSRQPVPVLDRSEFAAAGGLARGAYILADLGDGEPQLILMASGTEVDLIVNAGRILAAEGVRVRLVSFPSWNLFEKQDAAYKENVLPREITARLAVEAGIAQGWERYTGCAGQTVTLNRYGASAPYKKIFAELGFTPEHVADVARKLWAENKRG